MEASKPSIKPVANHSNSRKKRALKHRKKKPFRFLDLPFDIRRDIYDICLVVKVPLCIRIDTSNGGNGIADIPQDKAADYDDLVNLTSTHADMILSEIHYRDTRRLFTPGLLGTCRIIHLEAAPVFYSQNTFRFEDEAGLDAFVFFKQRLRGNNQASIRHLDVTIPQIVRLWNSIDGSCELSFDPFDDWFIHAIESFPALRSLHLRLDQDVLSGEISVLERFYAIKGTKELSLEFGIAEHCHEHGSYPRSTRIDFRVSADILKWDWKVTGCKLEVNSAHEFLEEIWKSKLLEEDEWSLKAHSRKRSAFVKIKA